MKVFEGKLVSEKIKIGIVAARFNEFITLISQRKIPTNNWVGTTEQF